MPNGMLSPYDEAHLFVAAIRVLNHKNAAPPSVEDICKEVSLSVEWGHATCHKLKNLGVIQAAEGPFGAKIFIADHQKIEALPKEIKATGMDKEIEEYKKSKEGMTKKVEAIQAELARKRQDLFAELDKKLKNQ